MNGYDMALASWLLADRLAPEVCSLMRGEVMRRVIQPTLDHLGIHPAFADASLGSRPDPLLVSHLARRGLPVPGGDFDPGRVLNGRMLLYQALTCAFPFRLEGAPQVAAAVPSLCTWLPDGGVYIGRPAAKGGLAVACKGGHNAEHHNHNDVGTTMAVADGQLVLTDPGAMVYTRETFSGERYRFGPMSSFGHAVPEMRSGDSGCRTRA